MTFLDPARQPVLAVRAIDHFERLRRIAVGRRRDGDEDGARRALGNDPSIPPAFMAGASLEHLARIALG